MVRTRLNIGCRYSTPVLERPLHPTRSQFKPQPSQTQAPVTPATEPERRAGGGSTTTQARAVSVLPLASTGTGVSSPCRRSAASTWAAIRSCSGLSAPDEVAGGVVDAEQVRPLVRTAAPVEAPEIDPVLRARVEFDLVPVAVCSRCGPPPAPRPARSTSPPAASPPPTPWPCPPRCSRAARSRPHPPGRGPRSRPAGAAPGPPPSRPSA